MNKEEELVKIILESHEYLDKNAITIKDIHFSTCFGGLPEKYQRGKKTHGEWRTLDVKVEFSDSYRHHFDTLEELFDKLKRLTNWEFDGFGVEMNRILEFNFNNYQSIKYSGDD